MHLREDLFLVWFGVVGLGFSVFCFGGWVWGVCLGAFLVWYGLVVLCSCVLCVLVVWLRVVWCLMGCCIKGGAEFSCSGDLASVLICFFLLLEFIWILFYNFRLSVVFWLVFNTVPFMGSRQSCVCSYI